MIESENSPPAERGPWSPYTIWALLLLTMITIFNYADRAVLGIVQEPIKHEFKLSDGQLGLLHGAAFVVLYAIVGLPIARFADTRSRKIILSVIATLWSAAAALCGLVTGFGQLLASRVLVGAAESGATPISISLIADIFPLSARGKATAVYGAGLPLGILIASVTGGFVAHQWGWRAAFVVVGAPGVVLGLLVALTLREPVRGHFEQTDPSAPTPGFWATVRRLMSKPSYVQVMLSSAACGFAAYGVNAFATSFYLRVHGMNLAQAGLLIGATMGVSGFLGTLAGGLVTDWLAVKDMRPYVVVPGVAMVGAAIFFTIAFNVSSLPVSAALLIAGYFCNGIKTSPQWASTQNLANPKSRVVAAALVMMGTTVFGLGLGPSVVGLVSDHLAADAFPANLGGYSAMCPGGRPIASAALQIGQSCRVASGVGLKGALMISVAAYLWAAVHSLWAVRTVREDMASG